MAIRLDEISAPKLDPGTLRELIRQAQAHFLVSDYVEAWLQDLLDWQEKEQSANTPLHAASKRLREIANEPTEVEYTRDFNAGWEAACDWLDDIANGVEPTGSTPAPRIPDYLAEALKKWHAWRYWKAAENSSFEDAIAAAIDRAEKEGVL